MTRFTKPFALALLMTAI